MGREWRVSASSGLPRWGLPSERGSLPSPRSSPSFPLHFSAVSTEFSTGCGKVVESGDKSGEGMWKCGKKVRKRAGKRLLRAGFDRLWKTPWKTWKTPGFAHCTQVFHKCFPESFPVWKTDVADLRDNVPSCAGLTGSSDYFNRLSRVFRPFCYRFSDKAAGKRAAKPIYRAGKRDIFSFPQS